LVYKRCCGAGSVLQTVAYVPVTAEVWFSKSSLDFLILYVTNLVLKLSVQI